MSCIQQLGQSLAGAVLEKADDAVMRQREPGLVVEGFRERRVVTLFGDVRVRRRLYRDRVGKPRFLLDEVMGLDKRSPLSPGVRELSVMLATYLPFAKCAQLLQKLVPDAASHTTIHRQVARMSEPDLRQEEQEVEEVFEEGKVPEMGKKQVPLLLVEGDGVSIALQREEARRAEVKVGIAYEGWEQVGQRHRVKEKTAYLGLMDTDRFWEGFTLKLAKKYDLSKVGQVVVGGDGASWVKEGAGFMGGVYQLDRFHLRRALLRGLGDDLSMVTEVYQACLAGDVALADKLLQQVQGHSSAERAKAIAELRGYILGNAGGLVDYRDRLGLTGLRGLGAIEGNVDKLVASRMKKRGMSWTIRGARRMTRLIQMQQGGEVASWRSPPRPQKLAAPKRKPTPTYANRKRGSAGAWLNMDMPALHGPHRNHPWALVLDRIAHGPRSILHTTPGFKPTKP